MKHLNEYIKESLLDVDDFDLDKIIQIEKIKEFIDENYDVKSYTISKKPNKDGKYVVDSKSDIMVKNKNITNLTNDLFVWGEVGRDFDCRHCSSLTSLKGTPEKVGGSFRCPYCDSLTSLEGAPKKVGENFNCYWCDLLTSLKGAPKEVGGKFDCKHCESLTSLKGAPKEVGMNFNCYNCKTQFAEDDVRKVSNVKGKIIC